MTPKRADGKKDIKKESPAKFIDPWAQAIATVGLPKIPKKKKPVSFNILVGVRVIIITLQ